MVFLRKGAHLWRLKPQLNNRALVSRTSEAPVGKSKSKQWRIMRILKSASWAMLEHIRPWNTPVYKNNSKQWRILRIPHCTRGPKVLQIAKNAMKSTIFWTQEVSTEATLYASKAGPEQSDPDRTSVFLRKGPLLQIWRQIGSQSSLVTTQATVGPPNTHF